MDKEMEAINGCVKALETIEDDKEALRRALSYLMRRFKPSTATVTRVRAGDGQDHLVGSSGPGGQSE